MDKIKLAESLLTDKKEDLEMYKNLLYCADKKYCGEQLERQKQSYTRRINELKVETESLEHYMRYLEWQLNGDSPY